MRRCRERNLSLISIHAPRTGSDTFALQNRALFVQFQSTLPARGATAGATSPDNTTGRFQSTLPARGATASSSSSAAMASHFNPRSPHGERRRRFVFPLSGRVFQSTLPARGATNQKQRQNSAIAISIHAPRTGSDPLGARRHGRRPYDFNPRSPHGERQPEPAQLNPETEFQSTLPARGATRERPKTATKKEISIHAPRTGSDV